MSKLPSFEQFNESIKITDINEGVFHRLPKNIISDELYLTSKNLQNFYDRTAAGNDIDPGVIDTIIRGLDKVKKAVKRFNSKEEVTGTVYESSNHMANIGDKLSFTGASDGEVIDIDLFSYAKDKHKLANDLTHKNMTVYVIKYKDGHVTAVPSDTLMSKIKDNTIKVIKESLVNEAMSFDELKNKYIDNPYGIGAQLVVFEPGTGGNANRLVFKHDERSRRDNIESKLKDLGFATKKMSKSTADKAFKYRYELTLYESEEVNEAMVQVAGNAKPSGAQVLATVIIDALDKKDFLHPDTKKSHKQLIEMVKQVIMNSTF